MYATPTYVIKALSLVTIKTSLRKKVKTLNGAGIALLGKFVNMFQL